MRRYKQSILFIITILCLTGCIQAKDNTDTTVETSAVKVFETNEHVENMQSSTKNYILKSDKEEFIPHIIINESDKTFSISYDVLSSYLAAGTYTENNNQLALKTDDGKYHYTFDVVDDNTLTFNQKNSSDIDDIMGEGVKDGAEFIIDAPNPHTKDSPLPESITDTSELGLLRKLYIDFPQTANYQEAISFIQESDLPYSEKKRNGSRNIKIALNKYDAVIEDTAIDTFKEYDYIMVDYMYPKMEDDNHDELNKYLFRGIIYVSAEGRYQLESHVENTYITTDGEVIDSLMNREEQMHFLENHTGLAIDKREAVSADIEKCIREKFAAFEEECELMDLWYDKEKSDRIIESYMKYGRGSDNGVKRENIIAIMSDLKTGDNTWSLEPNTVYADWIWILIRDNQDSEWVVDDYGNE